MPSPLLFHKKYDSTGYEILEMSFDIGSNMWMISGKKIYMNGGIPKIFQYEFFHKNDINIAIETFNRRKIRPSKMSTEIPTLIGSR